LAPQVPPVQRVGNWLEGTFWTELGRQGPQKANADRSEFGRSYRYSITQRDRIDQRIRELSGPRKCDLQAQAEFWIEPANLPDTLTIYFLPAKAEIRVFEDVLLVDTGVVAAGSLDQIIRQMTSLLYRKYQYLEGPNPTELSGAAAVAQVFRIIMNEGLAGWIDRTVETHFALDHPTLAKFQVIPERYFTTAQKTINLLNRHLGPMLDGEAALTAKANDLVMTLGTMSAYNQAGYAMAAVIAARLGESRLRDSGRSVPAFIAAYQEAALQNPVPPPAPGARGVELHQTVPALKPEVFAKLQSFLQEHFPQ
jgi:hypothetical protein